MRGHDIGKPGDPYLDRLRLLSCPWFGVFLHKIHRADSDRHPHDHPWWFASIVLSGSYAEVVYPRKHIQFGGFKYRVRRRFSIHFMGRKAAHMITAVDGSLWTLVIHGPRRSDWGFWVPADRATTNFVPWQEYIR